MRFLALPDRLELDIGIRHAIGRASAVSGRAIAPSHENMLGSGYSICRRQRDVCARHVLYYNGDLPLTSVKRECQKSLGDPLCRQRYIGVRHYILRLRRVCCLAVAPAIKDVVFPNKTTLRREGNGSALKFGNLRRNRSSASGKIKRQTCQRCELDLIQPHAVLAYIALVNFILCIRPSNHMAAFTCDIDDFPPPTCLAAHGDAIETVLLLVERSLRHTIYRKICIVKDLIAVRFARRLPPE